MENEKPIEAKKYWKWWQWTLLIVGVVVVLSVIGSACGTKKEKPTVPAVQEQGKNTAPKEETKIELTKQWIVITELKGNADKSSDTFRLNGGKVRLTYNFQGNVAVFGGVYILKEGVDLMTDGGIPEVMVSEVGGDSTIVRKAKGDYYLKVVSANANYTVKLEEER